MRLISMVREGMNRYRARKLPKCGEHVWISRTAHLQGNNEVGDDVRIGDRANFVSTMATLRIGSHVVLGPDVTIYTGDHATDFLGYHISGITDDMKRARGKAYDRDQGCSALLGLCGRTGCQGISAVHGGADRGA